MTVNYSCRRSDSTNYVVNYVVNYDDHGVRGGNLGVVLGGAPRAP